MSAVKLDSKGDDGLASGETLPEPVHRIDVSLKYEVEPHGRLQIRGGLVSHKGACLLTARNNSKQREFVLKEKFKRVTRWHDPLRN